MFFGYAGTIINNHKHKNIYRQEFTFKVLFTINKTANKVSGICSDKNSLILLTKFLYDRPF